MYQRILVAYDDSPTARHALAQAVDLARLTGAGLTAVAVEAHPGHSGVWSRIARTTAEKLATGRVPCPILIVP